MEPIANTLQRLEYNIFLEETHESHGKAFGIAYSENREDEHSPISYFIGVFKCGKTVCRGKDGQRVYVLDDKSNESAVIIYLILREIGRYHTHINEIPQEFHYALGLTPFTRDRKPKSPTP